MAMIAAGVTPEDSPQRVSFYFAPHEDDWQLFMNPSAFHDVLESSTKGVFIHVTAGDAGLGTNNGGRQHPLYLARESGAECAIRFMAEFQTIARQPKKPYQLRHSTAARSAA